MSSNESIGYEESDLENSEASVEIQLKSPFTVVNPEDRDTCKVEYVSLNSPSFYKKNKILQLRRLVISKLMAMAQKQTTLQNPADTKVMDADTDEDKIEGLKSQVKFLIYSGQFDEKEFDKLRNLVSEILITSVDDAKKISQDCLPCLVHTESGAIMPFSSVHLTKLSTNDFEKIMIEYLANFITASLM